MKTCCKFKFPILTLVMALCCPFCMFAGGNGSENETVVSSPDQKTKVLFP